MSTMYEKGKTNILNANIDLLNDDIVATLISYATYTPNFSTDETLGDIPEVSRLHEVSLEGKTTNGAVFLADDLDIEGLTLTTAVDAIVIAKAGEEFSTSPLVCLLEAPEFPITPDGSQITIQWDTTPGGNGIFKI